MAEKIAKKNDQHPIKLEKHLSLQQARKIMRWSSLDITPEVRIVYHHHYDAIKTHVRNDEHEGAVDDRICCARQLRRNPCAVLVLRHSCVCPEPMNENHGG